MNTFRLLFFIPFLLLTVTTASADELVIIKAVSKSKKTFVIPKGHDEGVRVGQKRAFTTDKISIMARVIEVRNDMSLWQIVDTNAVIPFKRDQLVIATTANESIWTDIARLENKYQNILDNRARIERGEHYFITKLNLTRGVAESTTDTNADQSLVRVGFQLEGLYAQGSPFERLEWAAGFRYDRDAITVTSSSTFTIISQRLLFIADLQYNFDYIDNVRGNFYIGLTTGYGYSTSEVFDERSNGPSALIPCARIGFRNQLNDTTFLYELALEALNTTEKFSVGVNQRTTLINSKFNIGLRF